VPIDMASPFDVQCVFGSHHEVSMPPTKTAPADDSRNAPQSTPVDPRKRQIATVCFQKATEAMSKENWDYAIEMFGQCVTLVPDNLMYRQTLRGVQYKKYKNNGSGVSMAGMRLMGIRSEVKKARSAKKWAEMDAAVEKGLVLNPWDPHLNADLGEAALQQGHNDVALYGYQSAVKLDGKNKDFLRGLAAALAAKSDFVGASKTWQKIYDLDPMDGEARSNIQACLSQATIHKAGLETSESTREAQQNFQGYEQSVKGNSAQQVVGPGDSPEEDLKRAIRREPNNKEHYQKLAELYRRGGQLELGLENYRKAFELSQDVVFREQAEDLELEIAKKRLEAAKSKVAKAEDPDAARQNVATMVKQLTEQEIDVLSRRIERYPNDLRMKYELAQLLMKAGKFSAATKHLQQASKDPRIEGPVLLNLGKCFLAEKQNLLAQRQFEKAIEKFTAADQPQEFVECHYFLARLAEAGKDLDSAERHFTEVLTVDYEYKDTQARLKKIQEMRGDDGLTGLVDI
jgi:tetratricopeptide (TPR) repeat protein